MGYPITYEVKICQYTIRSDPELHNVIVHVYDATGAKKTIYLLSSTSLETREWYK